MVRVRYSFGCRHTGRIENIKKQRGKYPDVMKDVVRISDIVLEILDARYIEETRNLEVEKDILKQGKILVYVFNKVDLVDRKELEAQIPKWMKPYVFVSATEGIGLKDLKARIKMESKRILTNRRLSARGVPSKLGTDVPFSSGKDGSEAKKEKFSVKKDKKMRDLKAKDTKGEVVKDFAGARRIHVGVIGYPNAGKSSVINFITRRGVAKTAKQAGFTKGMQKIRMSENILVLDTPGVIPASSYSTESKSFAQDVKVGGRTYSDVRDPEGAVFYLMVENGRVGRSEGRKVGGEAELPGLADEEGVKASKDGVAIASFYGIEFSGDIEEFIEELGRKKGFLGKGGVVDVDRTARIVLRDWQRGEIKFK